MLAGCPYAVRSRVSVDEFRLLISGLQDEQVSIPNDNIGGISLPCDEFRFIRLSEPTSTLSRSNNIKELMVMKDSEAQLRLSVLQVGSAVLYRLIHKELT
jgi:hypothetical protein